MASIVRKLAKAGSIAPPKFLVDNIQFETMTGSISYGVSSGGSDVDLVGFCIPDKDIVFPNLRGEIPGFGKQINRFGQFQQHHIDDAQKKKEYDITVYNIVKYFQLCMDCNPNMLDSLFVPDFCITAITKIGTMVRESRRLFLSKKVWHTFKGYAYSMLHKIGNRVNMEGYKELCAFEDSHDISKQTTLESIEKELELRKNVGNSTRSTQFKNLSYAEILEYHTIFKYCKDSNTTRFEAIKLSGGLDCKFAYHIVRLLDECEQILTDHDMDIQRDRERLKAIRRGEWSETQVREFFSAAETRLEELYVLSSLKNTPDEKVIKTLLIQCLEEHYGNLDDAIRLDDTARLLDQFATIEEALMAARSLINVRISKTNKQVSI